MKKLLPLFLILMSAPIMGQSIHSQNVGKITEFYWTYLNRPPDLKGLQFWVFDTDFNDKSYADLEKAFQESKEFQSRQNKELICSPDYTTRTTFLNVRNATSNELVVVRGKFAGRGLIGGLELDQLTGFLGNVIKVETPTCEYALWFDYAALGLVEGSRLVALLVNSKSIDVTFDPVSGRATSVVISEFKPTP